MWNLIKSTSVDYEGPVLLLQHSLRERSQDYTLPSSQLIPPQDAERSAGLREKISFRC
jgi:hypothetical protein